MHCVYLLNVYYSLSLERGVRIEGGVHLSDVMVVAGVP